MNPKKNYLKIIFAALLLIYSTAASLSAGEPEGKRLADPACHYTIIKPENWRTNKTTEKDSIITELSRNDETANINIVTVDTGEDLDIKTFRKYIEPELLTRKERKKLKPLSRKILPIFPDSDSRTAMPLYTFSSEINGYPVQVLIGYYTKSNLAFAITAIYLKSDKELQQEVYNILLSLSID